MMLSNGKVAKMPDKLTDNEIIKALECCCGGLTSDWCDKCPMNVTKECDKDLLALEKLALDLINRLQARVEKCEKVEHFADKTIATLQAENERLTIRLRKVEHQLDDAMKMYNTIKAEAYKEFAERLKGKFNDGDGVLYEHFLVHYQIDNLLKEMVGEDKPEERTLTIVRVRFNTKTNKTYDYEYIGEEPINLGDFVTVETEYQGEIDVEVMGIFRIKESQAEYDYKTARAIV